MRQTIANLLRRLANRLDPPAPIDDGTATPSGSGGPGPFRPR